MTEYLTFDEMLPYLRAGEKIANAEDVDQYSIYLKAEDQQVWIDQTANWVRPAVLHSIGVECILRYKWVIKRKDV